MSAPIIREVPVRPEMLMEGLQEATIAHESVISMTAPLDGYGNFVEESVSGEMQVISRINGNRFQLMPIGFWPLKGKSPLAAVGALHGLVESKGDGCNLQTQFRIFPIWKVLVAGMSILSALFVFGMTLLTLSGVEMESGSRVLLWCLTGATCAVTFYFVCYIYLGARNQAKVLQQFVEEFVASISNQKAVPGEERVSP